MKNKNATSQRFVFAGLAIATILLVVAGTAVLADNAPTSVTVGGAAPSFTVTVAESPASDGTTPTNAGSQIAFQATATDPNGDNYYLALCKTNSVTPSAGGPPTCGGGNWCISTSTTSGSQASCNYTTLDGDAETNVWYAFVCDGDSNGANCSNSSQGTGSSGSPFKVNHRPVFSTISNNTPRDPGQSVTWSTNSSTLDNDTDTAADTVKLVICKTTGLSAGDCDGGAGDRWCASSFVASNPSCSYAVPVPTADNSYNAYAYLVDSHNFEATGGNQGSNSSYVVNNITPAISSVTLNGGTDITLTESSTKSVVVTATVTDNNACTEVTTVDTSVYRSGVTYTSCDTLGEANANNCYAKITCSVGGGDTCDGATDASASYTCTINMQFHADPTDASTPFSAQNWLSTVYAIDDDTSSSTSTLGTGIEVLSLIAYDVTATIPFGSLGPGDSNDPLDVITTYTATGNVGLDAQMSGSQMCTNYPTCTGGTPIAVGQQRFAFAGSTAYTSGTQLTGSPTEYELNLQKTTVTGSPQTKSVYWGIEIPIGTISGGYTGQNVLGVIKSETGEW